MKIEQLDYDKLLVDVRGIISSNYNLIIDALDDEIPNWVHIDEYEYEEEYGDELDTHDYYHEHSNGEAGDAVYENVINDLIIDGMKKLGYDLSVFDSIDTYDIYNILNEETGLNEWK